MGGLEIKTIGTESDKENPLQKQQNNIDNSRYNHIIVFKLWLLHYIYKKEMNRN